MDFGFSKAASAILVIRPFRTPVFYRKKDNDNNSNKQTRKKNIALDSRKRVRVLRV